MDSKAKVMYRYIAYGTTSSAVDKFILTKLLLLASKEYSFEGSTKPLASKVGVSDKTLSKSLLYWNERGVLEKEKIPRLKGRSKSRYWIKLAKIKFMANRHLSSYKCLRKEFVDDLLRPDTSRDYSERSHPLKLETRQLLIVLFSHADNCGVVRGLGYSDLAKLSGLSRQSVITQLDKLKRESYIRSSVGGLTSSSLVGKDKTVFFLNLNNQRFEEIRQQGTIVIYQAFQEDRDLSEAARLIVATQSTQGEMGPMETIGAWGRLPLKYQYKGTEWLSSLKKLERFFNDQNVEAYLQLKLEEYAAQMLSNAQGNNLIKMMDNKQLRNRIRRDLLPLKDSQRLSSLGKEAVDCVPSDKEVHLLVEAIVKISHDIAFSIQQLSSGLGIEFNKMDHVLLPLPENRTKRCSFTLLSFSKNDRLSIGRVHLVRLKSDGSKKKRSLRSEDKFDDFDLLEYGLKSAPDPKTRTWENSKFKESKSNITPQEKS